MKRNIFCLVFFVISSLFCTLANAKSENYTFDPHHTSVVWHISHFGFSNPSGKWMVSGSVILDQKNPQNSKVNITIPIKDIVTGVPELDEHLQGPLFFDAKKFPTAAFVSNKVEVTDKTTAKVYGTLTLHGISKPVILDVILNKSGVNPITNKPSVGFSAAAELKRSDYGMSTLLPGVGDDVKINIEAEAYKNIDTNKDKDKVKAK
jgi:polyisoprenoid-binding protein YceI